MTSAEGEGLEEELAGGGTTRVVRVGGTVRRPIREWSSNVHALLRELLAKGFEGAPRFLGTDQEGREILEFLGGDVGHYPWTADVASEVALASAGQLLCRYHDAVGDIAQELREGWQFAALEPVEVICHGDFAPYNCVFQGPEMVGIIDFDVARPGPRAWDWAYALHRFSPFSRPADRDGFGFTTADQARRARVFLDAYGCSQAERRAAMNTVRPRLTALIDFMRESAEAGEENCARHIREGHLDLYLRDLDYIEEQEPVWATTVVG